jgi:hypothetical protein
LKDCVCLSVCVPIDGSSPNFGGGQGLSGRDVVVIDGIPTMELGVSCDRFEDLGVSISVGLNLCSTLEVGVLLVGSLGWGKC